MKKWRPVAGVVAVEPQVGVAARHPLAGLRHLVDDVIGQRRTESLPVAAVGAVPVAVDELGGVGHGTTPNHSPLTVLVPTVDHMYWENIVFDALDPRALGRFWEEALGTEQLTDEPGIYETRLHHDGGPDLDLCFQQVPEPPSEPLRLHLDLRGGAEQQSTVDRLLGLGASHLDIGQKDVPWVVLGDPEGNPFCVMEERAVYSDTGPLAALPLDSGDPDRDVGLWAWLTGWVPAPGVAPHSLRHASHRGPLLELCPEPGPKGEGKNRVHLDVRLEAGDDADEVARGVADRGGRELHHPEWGDLPWRFFADGSGNDFCVLPARD